MKGFHNCMVLERVKKYKMQEYRQLQVCKWRNKSATLRVVTRTAVAALRLREELLFFSTVI